jgi:hypothetical protein
MVNWLNIRGSITKTRIKPKRFFDLFSVPQTKASSFLAISKSLLAGFLRGIRKNFFSEFVLKN